MLPRCLARIKIRPQCRGYSSGSPPGGDKERIIFSGIQPTGTPHLGNYLGAMKNWTNLQGELSASATIIYSIVDLHAITLPYNPQVLRREREEMWRVLYAVGIDMERCIVFEQSAVRSTGKAAIDVEVPEHAQLHWILSSLTPMGLLNRMTQWKVPLLRELQWLMAVKIGAGASQRQNSSTRK